ncbi:MAG: molybdate ABC transporter permease subunit [Epsilonproteobacteria bacterium]|nr:molybdate ABC transporter permease subunit [Campylobacterota bacterium]
MDIVIDFTPIFLSLKLAAVTTFILFFLSLPIAYMLSFSQSKLKHFFESLIALPLVLPSSVLGFYLLWLFSDTSIIGAFLKEHFNIELVFSFEGIVLASCIYSLPFMVQPIQSAIENFDKTLINASYVLGKNKIQTFFYVILPNIKPSVITAVVLTFAHTIGEFGVVLMVGGSIPGVTKVASIAIYEYVENLDFYTAHIYSAILLVISFIVVFLVYYFNKRSYDRN